MLCGGGLIARGYSKLSGNPSNFLAHVELAKRMRGSSKFQNAFEFKFVQFWQFIKHGTLLYYLLSLM